MRWLILLLPLALSAAEPAVPDDAALLAWAKARATGAERVTDKPYLAGERIIWLCREPSPKQRRKLDPPHGQKFIHVFANEAAAAPLWDRLEKFPVGSLILKEKLPALPWNPVKDGQTPLQPGTVPELFTGMLKREPGYWPEHGDWEYFTLDGALTQVTSRGKTASCAQCHADVPEQDFVFRDYTLGWGPIGPTSRGRFFLSAQRAQLYGRVPRTEPTKLRYEPEPHKNTLGYWTDLTDWASWQLYVPEPGTYRIQILQGCGKGSGGAEVEIRLGDTAPLLFTVQDTGHFQNFVWRDLGTLHVPRPGPTRLEVRPRTKPGPAVMDLRQVRLELVK